jgi:hypothetical protein
MKFCVGIVEFKKNKWKYINVLTLVHQLIVIGSVKKPQSPRNDKRIKMNKYVGKNKLSNKK